MAENENSTQQNNLDSYVEGLRFSSKGNVYSGDWNKDSTGFF